MFCDDGLLQHFEIQGGNFSRAGRVSTTIKEILQEVGIDPGIIRRAAIASYEAEMNVVMYAQKADLTLKLTPDEITIRIEDQGPGIENIDQAMQEGFSTATDKMREMGFGAGMGLPNINRNADNFWIGSIRGKGTVLIITFLLKEEGKA
ncbi:MAG: ATP-binding protein [Candidatus Aminicenantaceae bacterium]|jgi:anti-sigma regulatory factor (Ser/Thr protein kinase)